MKVCIQPVAEIFFLFVKIYSDTGSRDEDNHYVTGDPGNSYIRGTVYSQLSPQLLAPTLGLDNVWLRATGTASKSEPLMSLNYIQDFGLYPKSTGKLLKAEAQSDKCLKILYF